MILDEKKLPTRLKKMEWISFDFVLNKQKIAKIPSSMVKDWKSKFKL